jgi:hypothetical protein
MMKTRITKIFWSAAWLGCCLLAAGCGKSSNKSSLIPDNLDGTWVIGCEDESGFPGADYVIKTLVFSSGSYSYTQDGYTNSSCTNKVLTVSETGTFSVSGKSQANGLKDLNLVQRSLTALTSDATELSTLNTYVTTVSGGTVNGICYHWEDVDNDPTNADVAISNLLTLGVAFDMTGLICGGGGANPANGSTILADYELTVTDATSTIQFGIPTTGQLGVVVVGKEADTVRPSSLDSTLVFFKQ